MCIEGYQRRRWPLEKMEGVGIGTASVADVAKAVGKIATEELDKIGKAATTNGQKLQSVSASWDNIKLSIGRAVTASREYAAISDIILGVGGALEKTDKSQDKITEGARRIFESFKKNGKISKEDAEARIKALKAENSQLLRSGDIVNKSTFTITLLILGIRMNTYCKTRQNNRTTTLLSFLSNVKHVTRLILPRPLPCSSCTSHRQPNQCVTLRGAHMT